MTTSQKISMFFNGKGSYLRVRIHDADKVTRVYYIKSQEGKTTITIDSRKEEYQINSKLIYMEDGFRTLTYNHNNPEPLDYLNYDPVPQISSREYYAGINETVTEKLISSTGMNWEKMFGPIKMLVLLGIGATAIGIFYVVSLISGLSDEFEQIRPIIEYIQELIAQGQLE